MQVIWNPCPADTANPYIGNTQVVKSHEMAKPEAVFKNVSMNDSHLDCINTFLLCSAACDTSVSLSMYSDCDRISRMALVSGFDWHTSEL
mgnify:CR=1 FL=1